MPNANDIRAGGAYIELSADQSELAKVLDAAQARTEAFGAALMNIGSKLAAAGGITVLLGGKLSFDLFSTAIGKIKSAVADSMEGMKANAKQVASEMQRIGLVGADTAGTIRERWGNASAVLFGMTKRIGEELGAAVMPMVTEAASKMIVWASHAARWIQNNRDIIAMVFSITAKVAAVGWIMMAVGKAVTMLAPAFGAISAVIGAIGAPAAMALAGIAALGAGILYWTGTGGDAVNWLRETFGTLYDSISDTLGAIGNAIAAGEFSAAFNVAWTGIKMAWAEGQNWIAQKWADFWNGIADGVENSANGIITAIESMVNKIVQAWASAVNALAKGIAKFLDDNPMIAKVVLGDVAPKTAAQNKAQAITNDMAASAANRVRANELRADLEENRGTMTDEEIKSLETEIARVDGLVSMYLDRARENQRRGEGDFVGPGLTEGLKGNEISVGRVTLAGMARSTANLVDVGSSGANAAAARKAFEEAQGKAKAFVPKTFDPSSVDLQSPEQSRKAAGSFSAMAASFMGADGGVAERTAKATEESAKQLQKLAKLINREYYENQGFVFS